LLTFGACRLFLVSGSLEKQKQKKFVFLCMVCAMMVYWFVSAPDTRFGSGFFWVLLGMGILFALPKTKNDYNLPVFWKNKTMRAFCVYVYVCALCIALLVGSTALSKKRNVISIGTIPSRSVREYRVEGKHPFTVWIPSDSDSDQTGNSPLPSSPGAWSLHGLEMRAPGNLGAGFQVQ
jgi:hypothetical protein